MIDDSKTELYKFSSQIEAQKDYPIHQLQEDSGIVWIVIGENDRVHNSTSAYFEVIKQANGDIHLRRIDIFAKT